MARTGASEAGGPDLRAADEAGIAAAVAVLSRGGLVGLPTETVYGLAADATDGAAVARIYAAKRRPHFNPLIAHVASIDAARAIAAFDQRAERLAEAFWPGPLTLVLPHRGGVSELARAGLDTVAVRIPGHAVARSVLERFGRPVAAPSANRSGHVSATTAAHVVDDLGAAVDLVLDAGACRAGIESTIVGLVGPAALLRPGAVPRAAIEAVIGPLARPDTAADGPTAPGMLESHYAPAARVRLDATRVAPGEALLAFGPALPVPQGAAVANLSPSADLVEAAANLFGHLRTLDAARPAAIAVMPIPADGLGEAIRDRLARAAAGR